MSTPRTWTVFSNDSGWPSGGTDRLGTVTRMPARPRNAGTFPISRHGLSFPGRVTVHWHGHVLSRATGQFDTSGVPPTSESSLDRNDVGNSIFQFQEKSCSTRILQQSTKRTSLKSARNTAARILCSRSLSMDISGCSGYSSGIAWAQERFEQIAGFAPPAAGGAEYGELSGSDRARWDEAAKILGRELGLAERRDDFMEIYIGSRKRTDRRR